MAFCEAVRTTSIPQSSKRISSQPTEHTPSTTTNVSGDKRWVSSDTVLMSESTPVEVSTWVTVIALYFFSFNAASICSKDGREPIGAFSCVGTAP